MYSQVRKTLTVPEAGNVLGVGRNAPDEQTSAPLAGGYRASVITDNGALRLPRLVARDRRLAAIHEAGHVVVARYLGSPVVSAHIWPNDGVDPYESHTWRGRSRCYIGGLRGTSKRMIGLAGAVAERAWCEPKFEWFEMLDGDLELVSPTDWKMCECDPDEGLDHRGMLALERVVNLIQRNGPLWGALTAEANDLIRDWRGADKNRFADSGLDGVW